MNSQIKTNTETKKDKTINLGSKLKNILFFMSGFIFCIFAFIVSLNLTPNESSEALSESAGTTAVDIIEQPKSTKILPKLEKITVDSFNLPLAEDAFDYHSQEDLRKIEPILKDHEEYPDYIEDLAGIGERGSDEEIDFHDIELIILEMQIIEDVDKEEDYIDLEKINREMKKMNDFIGDPLYGDAETLKEINSAIDKLESRISGHSHSS